MADYGLTLPTVPYASASGTPSTPASTLPSYMQTTPNYTDVMNKLSPIDPNSNSAGGNLFTQGQNLLSPSNSNFTITPGTQQIMDLIAKAQAKNKAEAIAGATGLAASRGQTGSSTEQFGVQRAGAEADQSAITAQVNALTQNEQQQAAASQLAASGYFNRANTSYTGALSNQQLGANLTSEEIASQRNAQYAQDTLALQKLLGEQGLAAAQANIAAETDIARQQAKNQILSSIIGTAGNIGGMYTLNKGGGLFNFMGTQGVGAGINGAGFGGATGGTANVAGLGTVGTASPAQFTPMFGQGGALFNTAGTSTIGAGNILPGLAGWQAGTAAFGDKRYTNTGGIAGATVGSLFGPLGSAAGGFIGAGVGKYGDQAYTSLKGNFGNTAGSFLKPFVNPVGTVVDIASNPGKAISSVAKSVTSVFPMITPKHKVKYN